MLHLLYLTHHRTSALQPWKYCFLLLLLFTLAACGMQSRESLRQAIVGKWVNAQNYSIEFYADGTGFVPAVEGDLPIPATDFTYIVADGSHVRISMGDIEPMNVEIKVEGDQMTWLNQGANIAYQYTRSK